MIETETTWIFITTIIYFGADINIDIKSTIISVPTFLIIIVESILIMRTW